MKIDEKQLRAIRGGVCAPNGFRGGFVVADRYGEALPLGAIVADRPCVAAGAFPINGYLADPISLSKRRLKIGRAQVLLFHGGRANVFKEDGEDLCDILCRLVETHTGISEEDVLTASFGEIGKPIGERHFEKIIPTLLEGLTSGEEGDFAVKQALGEGAESFSYAFDLWGYPCKIGGAYFVGRRERIVLITTDVRISHKALKKILDTEMKDTLGLLSVDGVDTPNDGIFLLSSGMASNYTIDYLDGEYKKFSRVLRSVLTEICVRTVKGAGIPLYCTVSGTKSKQEARRIAKTLVRLSAVKELFSDATPTETLAYALWGARGALADTELRLRSKCGERVLFSDGMPLPAKRENVQALYDEEGLELLVHFGEGNFSATAYGVLKKTL